MTVQFNPKTGGRLPPYLERRKRLRDEKRAADPINQISDIDLAYIAGLIDGEGSIYVACVGPKKLTVYPIVVVAMTDKDVIDWLSHKLFTKVISRFHNHTNMRKSGGRHKPQFSIRLHGRRAQLMCAKLLPYLKIKHEQARLVGEFPVEARCGLGRPVPDEIQSKRLDLRVRINALNHRRVHHVLKIRGVVVA